jgi:hypothetical protein
MEYDEIDARKYRVVGSYLPGSDAQKTEERRGVCVAVNFLVSIMHKTLWDLANFYNATIGVYQSAWFTSEIHGKSHKVLPRSTFPELVEDPFRG